MSTAIGLTPKDLPLAIYCGDLYTIPFAFNDGGTPPLPVDISGWTISAQIRTLQTSATPLAMFAVDMTSAATGKVVLSLTAAQTAALIDPTLGKSSAVFTWDFQRGVTATPTNIRTIYSGDVYVTLDRTRP